MKSLVLFLLILSLLMLVFGFAGRFHPFFDAIAAGRWIAIFAAVFFSILVLSSLKRFVLAIASMAVLVSITLISQKTPQEERGSLRIYSKNLYYRNVEFDDVAADILLARPDIVILQEVSGTNEAILIQLQDALPFQSRCPWQGWNGMAILSRWPLSEAGPFCSPERSLMAVQVERPNAPFWAIGVHLQQPWPDVQWAHLERGLPILDEVDGAAVVAGDFNTMPWTAAARKIGALTGTRYISPNETTFSLWGIGLPLDQVWGLGGRANVRPAFGSDHLGVLADVWPSQVP